MCDILRCIHHPPSLTPPSLPALTVRALVGEARGRGREVLHATAELRAPVAAVPAAEAKVDTAARVGVATDVAMVVLMLLLIMVLL